MSSSPSEDPTEFQRVKKVREEELVTAFKHELLEYIMHGLIVPHDGLILMADTAFGIDRKLLAAKALREIADDLDPVRT